MPNNEETKIKYLYFAYGSNMDKEQMDKRKVKVYSRKHAVLRGYKLVFNKVALNKEGVGYANIVPDDSEVVEGVLYKIDNKGLKNLDRCEGCPDHYIRRDIEVECEGKKCKAEVYVANEKMVEDGLKPTREYMNHLLKGSDLLSEEYVEKLKRVETID